MASLEAIVGRRAQALTRLQQVSQRLGEEGGLAVPNLIPFDHDPELARVKQLEAIVEFLEQLSPAPASALPAQQQEPSGEEASHEEVGSEKVTDPQQEEVVVTPEPPNKLSPADRMAKARAARGLNLGKNKKGGK